MDNERLGQMRNMFRDGRGLQAVALILLAGALGVTGCRSGRTGTAGSSPDGVLPARGIGQAEGTEMRGSPFEGEGRRGQFSPVYFEYDSSTVAALERPKLEAVAAHMRSSRDARMVVEGHCDERGSAEYNIALGERRALEVRGCLVTLGVDPDRVQTRSFGEEQPAAAGHGEEAWRLNRRGEFVVFGQ